VVAFNTAEGWSRDVSEEIADELRQRLALQLSFCFEVRSPSDRLVSSAPE
jgi:hypothetical protein